jgi:Cu/Ag efflux protein CusF
MTRAIALLLFSFFLFTACTNLDVYDKKRATTGPAAAVQTTSHRGVGTVMNLKPNVPSIEIKHEDIPDLMPAMQMEFHVKDKSLLDGLEIGNRVEFTVESGVGGLRITALKRL